MKAILRTLIIITMMVIGTVSANAIVHIDTDLLSDPQETASTEMQLKKKKCHICHIHTELCGGKYVRDRTRVYPGMNKRLRHHILRGHHKWHRDVCRKCHLTKKEIRKMEVEVRKLENETHKSYAERQKAKDARHDAKVARHNAKVERHNARVARHKAHRIEKHNEKAERYNAKVARHNAKKEERKAKKNIK